jgi:hypothetical protein
VAGISLMTAVAALTALIFGLTAFGESLGSTAAVVALHIMAIGSVLGCVPVLVAAQQDAADGDRSSPHRTYGARVLRVGAIVATSAAALVALVAALLAATGLLYGLRGLGWFGGTPKIANALPLLQLAGRDAQPLSRVIVASVLGGVAFGMLTHRIRPLPRAMFAVVLGLILLLLASDASLALARNDRLSDVLTTTMPGLGSWLEAGLFALGAALPGSRGVRTPQAVWRVIRCKPLVSGRPS